MKRRAFLTALGGAAAWPFAARAQDAAARPIAFLHGAPSAKLLHVVNSVRQGIEQNSPAGQSVTIETRWAEGAYERLPALADELVRLRPAAIVAGGAAAALAVKATGTGIPLVFTSGSDPVKDGLVRSLSRPGGNITGLSLIAAALGPKRLELMRALMPEVTLFGVLINPDNPSIQAELRDLEGSARIMGLELLVVEATDAQGIAAAFTTLARRRAGALMVTVDATFNSRREQIIALAARDALPAIYYADEFTSSGGLISYGSSLAETYRQVGIYVARILQGAKPADLPVLQPTTLDLVINMRTANALGLTIPRLLMARATTVIQ